MANDGFIGSLNNSRQVCGGGLLAEQTSDGQLIESEHASEIKG